jgi:glyoxylase-like metal-dependent hydrolase (beta-lactamase superfamily II)
MLVPIPLPICNALITSAGDAIVGDLIMGGYLGGWLRPQRAGLHYFAEDLDALNQSIRNVLALAPAIVYPAHGGPLKPADIARLAARLGRARGLRAPEARG